MKEKPTAWRIRGPRQLPSISAFAQKAWYYQEEKRLTVCVETKTNNVCVVHLPLSLVQHYVEAIAAWNRRKP